MAGLQLAPHLPVGVMFPHNKTEAAGLRSAKQDPYEQGDTAQQSSTGHPRHSFQKKLLSSQELPQEALATHSTQDTCTKAQSDSYLRHVYIGQRDSRSDPQDQGKGLWNASGHASWRPKATNQDLNPFGKKRVGVDRAYPLKPMVHRKSHSTGEASPDGNQHAYARSPAPYSCLASRNCPNVSVVGAVLAAVQGEKAVANLGRSEWAQIQRLEALGESLEEEIRRKEILLRNKLKKTEQELRRIQKEREGTEENDPWDLQRTLLPRQRVQGSGGHPTRHPLFPSEFESEEVPSRDRREDETWAWSQENCNPFQYSSHGLQRLKRERLVASNTKPKDGISGTSEKCCQPSEVPDQRNSPNPNPHRAPGSAGSGCSTQELALGKCDHCGRTFLLSRLQRHSNVCSRMQGAKRKVFDSCRARAKGTELEQYLNWKGQTSVQPEAPRKSNWRQKHECFIQTLRQAREAQQVIAKGGNPSDLPPIPPVENPDYIQCPHCSRRFAPKVAERHVPKCKTIKCRPPPPRKHYG
ncbi:zinc finger C2HC domain-containing protein 1C [Ochotona curzoniae]|uniref:zinc finger C2HC domain-containing protein 1C n=1 Tax=Ochotona curzoniae TaxID=130825 RepID=UPI001B3472EA|nr:zinc finger C2HC domain-containing protein 1C [Ochotona curzoniae]